MELICKDDARREDIRRSAALHGIDYVEVTDDPPTLYVYFLGKLPPQLGKGGSALAQLLQITGGQHIRGLRIVDVDAETDPDPQHGDWLVVKLDRAGDFSSYTLALVGVQGIDPQYATARFSFKVDCPSDLDCKPPCDCQPAASVAPHIDYLAKDYASFRQLLLDRLALLVPDWNERHVPDIGITLVELLAYVGDNLSYYQDAVATEAYLATARQRISVRRHARLIDYRLHEGCNARAWVAVQVSEDQALPSAELAFVTGANALFANKPSILGPGDLSGVPAGAYEYFEPITSEAQVEWLAAHNEIHLYTWGNRECCLSQGSVRATLEDNQRALKIIPGTILIFEEVIGPRTAVAADADPRHRHAVRVTNVQAMEDPLYSIKVLQIEWSPEDALPFPVCVSALGPTPDCKYISNITVIRGNVVLVDHGCSQDPEALCEVPTSEGESCCQCEGEPSDVSLTPGRYRPELARSALTHRVAPVNGRPASQTLVQDPRAAAPQIALTDSSSAAWNVQFDLLGSGPDARDFVVEIDNDSHAHLRFGDGELGRQPDAGSTFTASYRIGGGVVGNVGPEAISHLLTKKTRLNGVVIQVRNPLPAVGGVDPEPLAEAKLYAPTTFRKQLARAITAADYAALAQRDPAIQRAAATLAWTGSWYEADVEIDPLHKEHAGRPLLQRIERDLRQFRRMGHDLRVQEAVYVPIGLALDICVLPGYDRGHVKEAVLQRMAVFFAPDNLTFGTAIKASQIVGAVQAIKGVSCVTVSELRRQFEPPNAELENGLLPLGAGEIAQLDNDPNHPERGYLHINMGGGRL